MLRLILTLLPALALAACASTPRGVTPPPTPEAARAVAVFRGDGSSASWSDLVNTASGAEAVLVGESHGHPLGLAASAALFSDTLKQSPNGALALEFFERDEQLALDDYLAGVTDAKAFETAARRNPGNYPPGHRAMVESARVAKRPVIAANAPRRYVRLARTEGYDRLKQLNDSQRRLFRIPEFLATGPYRDAFDKLMGHDEPSAKPPKPAKGDAEKPETPEDRQKRMDALFRSQQLWDWTMSESVAHCIDAGNTPTYLEVGSFHVDNTGGLVQALKAQRAATRIVTISLVSESSDHLRDEDKSRADFILYVGPAPESMK